MMAQDASGMFCAFNIVIIHVMYLLESYILCDLGFGVNGFIDYWNNIYRFGFMMHLVPQQEPPKQ